MFHRLALVSSCRQSNVIFARSFRSTTPIGASKQAKTRKKLSELPEVYVLPNGQVATPLEPWSDSAPSELELPAVKSTQRKPRKRIAREAPAAEEPAPVGPARSQLAREILSNLQRFPHCLLLTRVGSFYESYFDQANEIASLLSIKLTSRKWGGGRVPMCGFPLIHLDKYLKILVQQHKRSVAMCEEFPRQTEFGEKEFDRRITRIISPGTLIDEQFLEPSENNFLLSISLPPDASKAFPVGLAWIDVSIGEFYSKECHIETLEDELVRINPREVVLESSMSHPSTLQLLKEQSIHFTFASSPEDSSLPPPSSSPMSQEAEAVSLLSLYLHSTLLEFSPSLGSPLRETDSGRMHIDAHTIKSLELRETDYDDSTRGSLLNVIRRTVTTSGTRLLSRRLCSPSASLPEVQQWQSLVSFFLDRPHLHFDLRESLKGAADVGRIVQRFCLRKGTIDDLIAVKKTIDLWTSISSRFQVERELEGHKPTGGWETVDQLMTSRLSDLSALATRIQEAITQLAQSDPEELQDLDQIEHAEGLDAQPNTEVSVDGLKWIINPNFSPKLSTLYAEMDRLLKQKEALQVRLQTEYNAPSLTLRSSSQQGMQVHLSRARRDQVKLNVEPNFGKISESATTKTYIYQPWSQLGGMIGSTAIAIAAAEKQAFAQLISEVLAHADALKTNVIVLDELDVGLGFATLANEMNFTRPIITEDATYHVVDGRHPSVEMGLLVSGRTFTPNTIEMTPQSNMHIITGPNMAGKSTVLRQTAIIAILAQIGSFVPAESATIGIVDKLFTRIGAKDDLFRDRSTFMVEMMETADILRRATPKSLVIMDEVGRGTTMKDGLAIAFATVHHLITENCSRCLFATHFHELSDMLGCTDQWRGGGIFNNIKFFCTDVDELDNERFVYSYRLHPGVNRDSHGLKVAKLAGLPTSALQVAMKTLGQLDADPKFNQRFDSKEISYSKSLQ